jgi:hypothetical protein
MLPPETAAVVGGRLHQLHDLVERRFGDLLFRR